MNAIVSAEEAKNIKAVVTDVFGGTPNISASSGPYIYIYYDPADGGRPFYVGKGSAKRCIDAANRSRYFLNKLRSMSKGGRTPAITLAFLSSHERALELEGILVEFFGRKDLGLGPLVNLTDGGIGIANPSQETRKKIAASKVGKARTAETIAKIVASKLGRPLSPETLARVRAAALKRIGMKMSRSAAEKTAAWHRGRKRSAETVERIRAARLRQVISPEQAARRIAAVRAALIGKPLSQAHRAKVSAARMGKFTGRHPSAATRAKMSTAHRGRKHSAESIEKMRLAKLGKPKSPEARARMSAAKKAMWAARRQTTSLAAGA